MLCLRIVVQVDRGSPAWRETELPECYGFTKAQASAEFSGMVW